METGIIVAGAFFNMMEDFYRRTGKSVIDIPLAPTPSFDKLVLGGASLRFIKERERYERIDMQGIIAWKLRVENG